MSRDILVRPDLDSIAYMTESTLRAWGIPFTYLKNPTDLGPLKESWARAQSEERPVALLIDASFS